MQRPGWKARKKTSKYRNETPVYFDAPLEEPRFEDSLNIKELASSRALAVACEAAAHRLRKEFRGREVATTWQMGFEKPNLIGWDLKLDPRNEHSTAGSLRAVERCVQLLETLGEFSSNAWPVRTAEALTTTEGPRRGTRQLAVLTRPEDYDATGNRAKNGCIEFGFGAQPNVAMTRTMGFMNKLFDETPPVDHFLHYLYPSAIFLEQRCDVCT